MIRLKASVNTVMAAAGATNVGDIEEDASQLSFPKGGIRGRYFYSHVALQAVINAYMTDLARHACLAVLHIVFLRMRKSPFITRWLIQYIL